ncbi:hypothetical protein [Trabulsiella odontotermitis]|uniref:RiboL-PSP-HEPN domain-containing protein n=1 Tax=Trabulsiella odontotermitis TaxID=379893 RepID=A0A0L0GIX5_9ENTR|nr:hypothetical protein [Trabulsiella odontotermitis]KNC88283.1 hypothetical protein GM31_11215 [Trabulsiella odontotermitis]
MSATKEWLFDVEESRREEWIRERLSNPDLDEYSEEWQQLEHDFNDYQDFLADMAQEEYEEQSWLKQNPHTTIYDSAITVLQEIIEEAKQHRSESFIKMQISYSVTIMESCLSEMLKSIALSNDRYVVHAINNIKELKNKSVPISDLLSEENTASKYVQDYLSGILYHKILQVVEVYKAVLQPQNYESFSLKDVLALTRLRHDIVHRNGKTTEGMTHNFTSEILEKAFETVNTFITHMKDLISSAVQYHESEEISRGLENF